MNILLNLIVSLILTILLELTSSLFLGVKSDNDIGTVIFVNICTNPVVVLIANILIVLNASTTLYYFFVIVMEILVVIIETLMYKKYLRDYRKSIFILSLVNNVISYLTGLLFNYLI